MKEKIYNIVVWMCITLVLGYATYKIFTYKNESFGALPCSVNPTQTKPLPSVTKQDKESAMVILNGDTALNSEIESVFKKIDLLQIVYFSKFGTYWHSIRTHAEPIEYGTRLIANNWDCKDEKTSWVTELPTISSSLPAQFQTLSLTRYDGKQEYTIIASVKKDGVQYNKSKTGDIISSWGAYE